MKAAQDIVIAPIITEKSMSVIADKKYTFKVATDANKVEIKNAVEKIFSGVKVEKVTTISVKGKEKRMGYNYGKTAAWKKAIVKLAPESKTIEFFDSLM